jgi:hypothetical protein
VAALSAKLRALPDRHQRKELLLYYSGHSDEESLLIGNDHLSYRELRSLITSVPVDVRIAILDSCASGAFVRLKGGSKHAPFLVDESGNATGYAYITSSTANESAQESDRVGASLFTHYLLSGLRGAADVTHDGIVTLNEAYQFAFAETLEHTERSQGGAQHPAYDISLAGSGDLVMTDLRTTSARLVLGPSIEGRVYIRDAAEHLVAELGKAARQSVELGLPPGAYRLTLEQQQQRYAALIELPDGQRVTLAANEFSPIANEVTTSRGDEPQVTASWWNRRVPDAPFLVQVYTSDIDLLNVSARYGRHHVYGIATAGLADTHSVFHASFGAGIGGHIPVGPFFIDIDTTANTFVYSGAPEVPNLVLTERLMLSWQILPHFGVFAGPTYNLSFAWEKQNEYGNDGDTLSFIGQHYFSSKNIIFCNWPGIVVGANL